MFGDPSSMAGRGDTTKRNNVEGSCGKRKHTHVLRGAGTFETPLIYACVCLFNETDRRDPTQQVRKRR